MASHCDLIPAHFIGHDKPNCVSLHSDGIWNPLRCSDVGSVVFSGKLQCNLAKVFLIPVEKSHHGTTVCCLEDRHLIESLSTKPVVSLNPLKTTR